MSVLKITSLVHLFGQSIMEAHSSCCHSVVISGLITKPGRSRSQTCHTSGFLGTLIILPWPSSWDFWAIWSVRSFLSILSSPGFPPRFSYVSSSFSISSDLISPSICSLLPFLSEVFLLSPASLTLLSERHFLLWSSSDAVKVARTSSRQLTLNASMFQNALLWLCSELSRERLSCPLTKAV